MKISNTSLLAIAVMFTVVTSNAQAGDAVNTFKCGSHVIETRDASGDEYTDVIIRFFDSSHHLVFPELKGSGTVISLCKQNEILLLDTNLIFEPGPSFLFFEDGRVLVSEKLGEVDNYGKSEDDKIFWIEVKDMRGKSAIVTLEVYSYQGMKLAEKVFTKAGNYSFKFEGATYTVPVMTPDYPG